uniref:Uncharacterized protein n=1 Tax=Guillardia theta TaxID=55529 RepID=A0A7S4UDW6_GUITH|mmetsp:Transcript_7523/g.25643  ORF Transcript_7523/g.25643 Transcript_7523/m.25643 type:complete len:354 (+) Transcript_7523:34-1095(+)
MARKVGVAGLLGLLVASGGSWGRTATEASSSLHAHEAHQHLQRLRGGAMQTGDAERMLKKMDADFHAHVKALENEDKEAAAKLNEIQNKFEKRIEEIGLKGRLRDPGRKQKIVDIGVPVDEEIYEMLLEEPPISHTRRNYTDEDPFIHPDENAEKEFLAYLDRADDLGSPPNAWIRHHRYPRLFRCENKLVACPYGNVVLPIKTALPWKTRATRTGRTFLKMNFRRNVDKQLIAGDSAAIFSAVFTHDIIQAAGQQGIQNLWGLSKPISANAEHLASSLCMGSSLVVSWIAIAALSSIGESSSLLCEASEAAYSALHKAIISAPLGLLLFLFCSGNHVDPNYLTLVTFEFQFL